MLRKVRAKVLDGKIEPLEDIELVEGEEIVILVNQPVQKAEAIRSMLKKTAGSWAGTLDFDTYFSDLSVRRKTNRPPVYFDR